MPRAWVCTRYRGILLLRLKFYLYNFTFYNTLTVCYLLVICTLAPLLSLITESRIIFEI